VCIQVLKCEKKSVKRKSDLVFLSGFMRAPLCLCFPGCSNLTVHLVVLVLCEAQTERQRKWPLSAVVQPHCASANVFITSVDSMHVDINTL